MSREETNIIFECHGMFTKFIRFFSVPLLNWVPSKIIRKIMKRSSQDAGTVVEKGGSTHALEVMYTRYHHRPFSQGFFKGLADFFWHHAISQPKALRNRLKIVEYFIKDAISRRIKDGRNVEILNVAGGSSRAIIHVLTDYKQNKQNLLVKITSIDKDANAIELGKEISEEYGVGESFIWINGQIRDLSRYVYEKRFDVIEVVGLLDYLSDEKVERLLILLREHLRQDGELIVANIMPNNEAPFIARTGWPAMQYRTYSELAEIILRTGFNKPYDIIAEPLKIHAVIRVSMH